MSDFLPTGPADWLLSFKGTQQEFRSPGLGNGQTRGGWLVAPAAKQAVTVGLLNHALEQMVERGWLEPVYYAPVAGPVCAPDPGTGCAAKWPPLPRDEPYGWQGRKSPAWAWVFKVTEKGGAIVESIKATVKTVVL